MEQSRPRKELINTNQHVLLYMNTTRLKAAHIYPFAPGTTVMVMLFGGSAVGELFGIRNSQFFKNRFDLPGRLCR